MAMAMTMAMVMAMAMVMKIAMAMAMTMAMVMTIAMTMAMTTTMTMTMAMARQQVAPAVAQEFVPDRASRKYNYRLHDTCGAEAVRDGIYEEHGTTSRWRESQAMTDYLV
jgi:hypothetical protein